jgi:hypothetical protein
MTWGGDARRKKKGLKVGHSHGLVKHKGQKHGKHEYESQPDGWYVYCWATTNSGHGWRPILGLCFIRQKDAERAMQALTAARFDTYDRLRTADAMQVRQLACEHLQW